MKMAAGGCAPIEQTTRPAAVLGIVLQYLSRTDSLKHLIKRDSFLRHLLLRVLGDSKVPTCRLVSDPGKNRIQFGHIEFAHLCKYSRPSRFSPPSSRQEPPTGAGARQQI